MELELTVDAAYMPTHLCQRSQRVLKANISIGMESEANLAAEVIDTVHS